MFPAFHPEALPWRERIWLLRQGGAPTVACRVLAALLPLLDLRQDLDAAEFFSGGFAGESVTKGFRFFGFKSVGLEIQKDERLHDFTSAEGFAFALTVIERLRPGGFSMKAPVCSNWIWLVRSSSGRSSAFPLGYTWDGTVAWSNMMVSRVVILLLLLTAKGCAWMLEQPLSSVLFLHPRFQQFLSTHPVYRMTLDMYDFGGETTKPTVLYCSHDWFDEMSSYAMERPPPLKTLASRVWDDETEKWCVTGGGNLNQSQHYPPSFGRSIARVFNSHKHEVRTAAVEQLQRLARSEEVGDDCDPWDDAGMDAVLAYAGA